MLNGAESCDDVEDAFVAVLPKSCRALIDGPVEGFADDAAFAAFLCGKLSTAQRVAEAEYFLARVHLREPEHRERAPYLRRVIARLEKFAADLET